MSATWKPVGVLALAFTAVTVLPTIATAAGVANPTFTKDIAPIFQQKCESCHRPDSMKKRGIFKTTVRRTSAPSAGAPPKLSEFKPSPVELEEIEYRFAALRPYLGTSSGREAVPPRKKS